MWMFPINVLQDRGYPKFVVCHARTVAEGLHYIWLGNIYISPRFCIDVPFHICGRVTQDIILVFYEYYAEEVFYVLVIGLLLQKNLPHLM